MELKRQRYRQKGRQGFAHPYIFSGTPVAMDYPLGETGPDERIYTDTVGVPNREEPLDMAERKLKVKIRDDFQCRNCGSREHLQVDHTKGKKSHRPKDLKTLCRKCHHAKHGYRQQTTT